MKAYQKTNSFYLADINCNVDTYTHTPSQATVVHLKNDDVNKTFGIAFKTIPTDSTGVAHVLEHSVLNGSRKFKVKEPFVELLKSSMNTFLNAMTDSDTTMYPVSSTIYQDFYNLVDVYLDAVFFPNVVTNPLIFQQEGWHYHLENTADDLSISGVVYNEMWGVYANAEAVVLEQIHNHLHPESTFMHNAGGDPMTIPDLTHQQLVDFHRTYYRPDNALIYFYGNLSEAEFTELLNLLERDYLAHFAARPEKYYVQLEKEKVNAAIKEFTYPGNPQDNQAYLSYSFTVGDCHNMTDIVMNGLLAKVLIDFDSAPLKLALQEKNLGVDVFSVQNSAYYNDFSIVVKGAKVQDMPLFIDTVEATLKELVTGGIDRNLLLAALNSSELAYLEADGTKKGLTYFLQLVSLWRYRPDFFGLLRLSEIYSAIRSKLNQGYFESYIQEHILHNPHKLLAIHQADEAYFTKLNQQVSTKLANYRKALSETQLNQLVADTQALSDYQNKVDSLAKKQTIPKLKLQDIDAKLPEIDTQTVKINDTAVLWQERNIRPLYVIASFAVEHLSTKELFNAILLTYLLGALDTKHYDFKQLEQKMLQYSSGINFGLRTYQNVEQQNYTLRLNVSGMALNHNEELLYQLMSEIILHTQFKQVDKIIEVLYMVKSRLEMNMEYMAHVLAMEAVGANMNEAGRVNYFMSGIEFYENLCQWLKQIAVVPDELIADLEMTYHKLFNRHNLVLAITGAKLNQPLIQQFIATIPLRNYPKCQLELPPLAAKRAYRISANVAYVAYGNQLSHFNIPYSGQLTILASILSFNYLYQEIRVKKGAYGAGIRFERNGNMVLYSYRDPNIAQTLLAMKQLPDYLKQLKMSESELEEAIIGSLMQFMPLISNNQLNSHALAHYFTDMSVAKLQQYLNEALSLTPADIKLWAQKLAPLFSDEYYCVVAGNEMLAKDTTVFDQVEKLK